MDSAVCKRWREGAPDEILLDRSTRGVVVLRAVVESCAKHLGGPCLVYLVRWVPDKGRVWVSNSFLMDMADNPQVWVQEDVDAPRLTFAWMGQRRIFATLLGRRVFAILSSQAWFSDRVHLCLLRSPWALWWAVTSLAMLVRFVIASRLLWWIGEPAAHAGERATLTHVGQAFGRWLLGPPFER